MAFDIWRTHRPCCTTTGGGSQPRSRVFAPLCPTSWTTAALQYLLDLIRRLESLGSAKASASTVPASDPVVSPAPTSLPAHASFPCTRPQPLAPLGFDTRVTFASWTRRLLRSVLRSRATFVGFLRSTLHLPRLPPDRPYVRSGNLFPLPVTMWGGI